MKCLIAYVPVLHKGYLSLFEKHRGELYLVGPDFVSEDFPRLIRDLRQLPVEDMVKAIEGLGIFKKVDVLTKENVKKISKEKRDIVMPEEDVNRGIAEKYFKNNTVRYENVFLRWDKPITLQELEVLPDRVISESSIHKKFIKFAKKESEKSADWWRQIGAVAVRGGEVLLQDHNKNLPTDYNLFAAGNPRDNFDAGEHPEIYPTIHAEAGVVAQAAREGVSLKEAEVYVTTFPCANCARLLTEAGISKIYYRDGYSMLDAEDILKASDVEIVLVKEDS
jgi:dCMP deaminase